VSDLAIVPTSGVQATLEIEHARSFIRSSRAAATLRAYASDWRRFEAWCVPRAVSALPASAGAVALFLTAEAQAGARASTISRKSAAIRYMHEINRHPAPTADPEVLALVAGIRRSIGTRTVQKAPATVGRLVAMLDHCPDSLKGKRDRALLALGFSGAFRRSELVALEAEDIEETEHGLRVLIRHSKTDQEGRGHEIAILRGAVVVQIELGAKWTNRSLGNGYAANTIFQISGAVLSLIRSLERSNCRL
jgi:site-specific recombinase XerC